jgi:hypothetical protein
MAAEVPLLPAGIRAITTPACRVKFPPISGHQEKRDNARGVSNGIDQESAPTEAQLHT